MKTYIKTVGKGLGIAAISYIVLNTVAWSLIGTGRYFYDFISNDEYTASDGFKALGKNVDDAINGWKLEIIGLK